MLATRGEQGKPPPVPPRPSKAVVAAALARSRLTPVPIARTILPPGGGVKQEERRDTIPVIANDDERCNKTFNGRVVETEKGTQSDTLSTSYTNSSRAAATHDTPVAQSLSSLSVKQTCTPQQVPLAVPKEEESHQRLHNGVFRHVEQCSSETVQKTTAAITFGRDMRQNKVRYAPLLPTGQHRHGRGVTPPQEAMHDGGVVLRENRTPPRDTKHVGSVEVLREKMPPQEAKHGGGVFEVLRENKIPPRDARHVGSVEMLRKVKTPPLGVKTDGDVALLREDKTTAHLVTRHDGDRVVLQENKTPHLVTRHVESMAVLPENRTPPFVARHDGGLALLPERKTPPLVTKHDGGKAVLPEKTPPLIAKHARSLALLPERRTPPQDIRHDESMAVFRENKTPPQASRHTGGMTLFREDETTPKAARHVVDMAILRGDETPPPRDVRHDGKRVLWEDTTMLQDARDDRDVAVHRENKIPPREIRHTNGMSVLREDKTPPPQDAVKDVPVTVRRESQTPPKEVRHNGMGILREGKTPAQDVRHDGRALLRDDKTLSPRILAPDKASPREEAPLIEDLVVELRESSRQRTALALEGARIQHSDWFKEDADGQQVRFSSCHITLQDLSQADPLAAINHFNCSHEKQHRRVMASLQGLPPLPKSLSGINLLELASPAPVTSPMPAPTPYRPSRAGPSHHGPPLAAPRARKSVGLDAQLAVLRKEMFGLRQLDLSLLSQLWSLNESIQEFRQLLQEQEDSAALSPPSPSSADEGEEFYSPLPRYHHAPGGLQLSAVPEQYRLSSSSSQSSIEYGNV